MRNDSLIDSIVSNELCVGCGLCASFAPAGSILMHFSDTGFMYPKVHKQLSQKDLVAIKNICPGINVQHGRKHENYHTIWGTILDSFVGYANNQDIRFQGSSGGVLSAIALHLLESKQVEFIAHIAVSHNDPLKNTLQISKNRSDIFRAAGSRYSPSALLEELHSLLELNCFFAVIGKPCDILALRNLAQLEPKVDKYIPYMLSFMCAGVPSEKGTIELLNYFSINTNDVDKLWYRGKGWPGKFTVETRTGELKQMGYKESWGKVLNKHLQFRCKICPDGTGEFADVVGGDAWHGDEGYPDFTEQDGRSILLARTNKGQKLIQECIDLKIINTKPLDIADISMMQPYQENRKKMIIARLCGSRFFASRFPRYRRLALLDAAVSAGLGSNVRNFIGAFRRAFKHWSSKCRTINNEKCL